MTDFKKFATLVRQHFDAMSTGEVFVVGVSGDELYETYLDAFPAGTNEIYRTRREFDCSADKNFIRNLGNVVTIVNGQLVTVWDIYDQAEYPFNVVAETLASLVRGNLINSVYRTKETSYGAELLRELQEDGSVHNWYNFSAKINKNQRTDEADKIKGEFNTKAQVFKRGLEELTPSSLTTTIDLIDAEEPLYRGAEFKKSVTEFAKLQKAYSLLNSDEARDIFVWANIGNVAAGLRNSVIGSLLQDLSAGVDMVDAVRLFESKVAPTNFKRSKSLITPNMIKDAMKTIDKLGLEKALERRFAKISDVTINNVLFVDNAVRGAMKGGIASLLMEEAVTAKPDVSKAENIGIEDFINNVVPKINSIDLVVKNSMVGNFMSMTAPIHDEVERLFRWDNNFAWSYDGNITDSIKEKVKNAGGNVTNAAMRVSLAWFNYDDLDIHVIEPNGNHIGYFNKCNKLDVDMNAGGRYSREPVENVSWLSSTLRDGLYKVVVNQFNKRESIDVGFVVEVENAGNIQNFSYSKVASGDTPVIDIMVKNGIITEIKTKKDIVGGISSKEKWGVNTETLVPVDTIIKSPNFWDDNNAGNKHWFFILKGCKNPDPVRGIYNEFLKPELEKHRKVFEVLGDKTKCVPSDSQLSGVGFSSTKKEQLTAFVKGEKIQKVYNINF